jgi:hypothetical protein
MINLPGLSQAYSDNQKYAEELQKSIESLQNLPDSISKEFASIALDSVPSNATVEDFVKGDAIITTIKTMAEKISNMEVPESFKAIKKTIEEKLQISDVLDKPVVEIIEYVQKECDGEMSEITDMFGEVVDAL